MSLRAASPPPRATTPEPILQPLPSPRLRPSRSIGRLKPLTTSSTSSATTTLSSHEEFHLTFDEFGTDHRMSPPRRFSPFDIHHSFCRLPKNTHVAPSNEEKIRSDVSVPTEPYPPQATTEIWLASSPSPPPSYTSPASSTAPIIPHFSRTQSHKQLRLRYTRCFDIPLNTFDFFR